VIESFGQDSLKKPNIVLILADDLGWTDLGVQGSKYYETPNIDRLASEGVRLQNHHHFQNCAPTRAALWSGQYAPRTGIYTVGTLARGNASDRKMEVPENKTELPLGLKTVGDQIRANGYRTAYLGKWHLGQQGAFHPSKRGWDYAVTSMGRHFQFQTQPEMKHNPDAYLADWLTDRALEFLDQSTDKPFFLVLAHFAVHTPLQAKPELIKKFETKPVANGHKNPTYAAMIQSVDESVGRVVSKLKQLQLEENTIVIFTSDNGGVGGYGDLANNITDNAPLRSGKGTHYEGGLRVPMIVRWPGVCEPGKMSQEPTSVVDIYPSLLDVTGSEYPEQTLDGKSLLPVWKNPEKAKLDRDYIFFHLPGYLEGRKGQWRTTPVSSIIGREYKLMEFLEDQTVELYDLTADVSESQNLVDDKPLVVKQMREELAHWRDSVKAAMPSKKVGQKTSEDIPVKKKRSQARKKVS
jgi:arylsulfatase A-like enzyme